MKTLLLEVFFLARQVILPLVSQRDRDVVFRAELGERLVNLDGDVLIDFVERRLTSDVEQLKSNGAATLELSEYLLQFDLHICLDRLLLDYLV